MILTPTMCSAQARAAELCVVGSAPSYHDYLLVGLPLPWPRDVGMAEPVAELQERCAELAPGRRVRVQAVVPAGSRDPGAPTVVRWWRPPGPFSGFHRAELELGSGGLVPACEEILAAEADGSEPVVRDVLVCGHGRRDRCCGRLGPRLLGELAAVPEEVRLWRSSHLGGHRYAPTALTFPEGAYWGFLDLPSFQVVLDHGDDPASVIDRYRGSGGIQHPSAQVVEASLLAREGWAALRYERSATVTGGDGRRTEVQLDFLRPDGSGGALLGTTELVRQVQLTECEGEEPGELVDELRLVELELAEAAPGA